MIIATNPRGQRVYFDERSHRYFHGDIELTSVTRFIRGFFPEFDAERIAAAYAVKNKKKKEDVLAMWVLKGERASELGHTVHAYAQARVMGSKEPVVPEEWAPYCEAVDKALAKMAQKFESLEPEKLVFSVEMGLAGTVDLLVRDKTNGDVVVIDWKTNEEFKFENPWETALQPIEYLDNVNTSEYRLQVNTYRKILIHEQYYPDAPGVRMALIHLRDGEPVFYPVKKMESEVNKMLEWV